MKSLELGHNIFKASFQVFLRASNKDNRIYTGAEIFKNTFYSVFDEKKSFNNPSNSLSFTNINYVTIFENTFKGNGRYNLLFNKLRGVTISKNTFFEP